MKKEYISPAMAVCLLETQQICAASKFDQNSDKPSITPTDEEQNEFPSRRHCSQWDDEEE